MRTNWNLRTPGALALAALLAGACSKSAATDNGGAGTGGSGGGGSGTGGGGGNTTPAMMGSCSNPTLEILFTPMYSAYIDGTKPFKIPAIVNGIAPDQVTWSASDPSYVDIETGVALGGTSAPTLKGAMITTRKAGMVNIIATAGGLCGVSQLTISQASMDDWMIGSSRYNDGITLTRAPGGRGGLMMSDAGVNTKDAACTNCHGDTATMLRYKTVSHTPQQTGGFSDMDLQNVFLHGMVPTGGYFDTTIVSYNQWSSFHQWQMTADEVRGITVYLRSLTPQAQAGMADFGGRNGDGGFRMRGDGGFRMRGDGGGMMGGGTGGTGGGTPTPDAADNTAADAASSD